MPHVTPPPRRLNPRKLMLSKWTAIHPVNREKHFIVTRVVKPEHPDDPIEWIDLQAVHSKRTQTLRWQTLLDTETWLQGWK
ncbi:TIGR02450 family Trp-rich protein [Marinobacterium weihaiense]|uniref:TIGR02450 family Trp-rich protein n=1 Tax=Marinobacterium weihaiense TaxID=2851016 RepID=A0ABS6MDX2_9GAMM|nr:TIGR02450 family Trp-rich protein [Marinobacterium weihaiense]MBV0934507.1 TIGR02450 family Trp-rich protein [Marinobacterium weihaiense]